MKKKKVFNPQRSVDTIPFQGIEVNVWSISMTTKTGEEIKIVGSTESEDYCWKLFADWKKSNSNSSFWNWTVDPKLEKKSYVRLVRN